MNFDQTLKPLMSMLPEGIKLRLYPDYGRIDLHLLQVYTGWSWQAVPNLKSRTLLEWEKDLRDNLHTIASMAVGEGYKQEATANLVSDAVNRCYEDRNTVLGAHVGPDGLPTGDLRRRLNRSAHHAWCDFLDREVALYVRRGSETPYRDAIRWVHTQSEADLVRDLWRELYRNARDGGGDGIVPAKPQPKVDIQYRKPDLAKIARELSDLTGLKISIEK